MSFDTFDRADTLIELENGVARAVCYFRGCTAPPITALHGWADRVPAHYRPPIWPSTPVGWVPRSVRLLGIRSARPHPWLRSTDLHVRQANTK